jgi:hypothetical protein
VLLILTFIVCTVWLAGAAAGGVQESLQPLLHAIQELKVDIFKKLDTDRSTEAISKYPSGKFQQLCTDLHLTPLDVSAPVDQENSNEEVSPFVWGDRSEPKHMEACLRHLEKYLHINGDCVLKSVDNRSDFLSVNAQTLGSAVGIQGTSDIALLDEKLATQDVPRAGILVLFELKKKAEEKDVRQAQLQLIAACKISNFRPVVVLTDLGLYWRFYWLKERNICMMIMSSASQAYNTLNQLLASHNNHDAGVNGLLPESLINRTRLVSSRTLTGAVQDDYDDYQETLMTKQERVEAQHKQIMLFAADRIPWMMYS